jgi:hypothetical protein
MLSKRSRLNALAPMPPYRPNAARLCTDKEESKVKANMRTGISRSGDIHNAWMIKLRLPV